LLTFLNPWHDPQKSGFQIIQSFVAIRAGGLFGQGIGDGVQKIFYLPEAHTDFVFSVICEELGFLGSVALILLYIVLITRGAQIAMRSADRFQGVLAAGLVLSIGMQAATNMAVVMGLLPTKGLTLPLVSFGGTSLVMVYAALGLVHNIASRNPI